MKNFIEENINVISDADYEIGNIIGMELKRQQNNLELIASENIVSPAVLSAMGSILTNKYAEGYPEHRYYGGCEYVDMVENIAIQRACQLFGAEHANVQPHSGSQANMAVYFAMLNPGDTVMGMNLSEGGHLTHGSRVNISGKLYNFVSYGVDKNTHRIDYEKILETALKVKPKMIVCGASAYPRIIDFKKFREIADECGAYLMTDMAHIAGPVAAGVHPSPVEYSDFVTATTHKTLRGPRGGLILCKEKYAKQIDKAIFPGIQGGPLMHTIAAKAVCFKEAMSNDFKEYSKKVIDNCKTLAEELNKLGVNLVSGGTDNHLLLIDLTNNGITGKELEDRLSTVNITVNKNTVPNETRSPFLTSGVRIGTAAVTSRGMNEIEMKTIAKCIYLAITEFESSKSRIVSCVKDLCDAHPIYN